MSLRRLIVFAFSLSVPFVAFAGEAHHGMAMPMADMHHRADKQLSGDPDVDFVRGMIPHHRMALEMAQAELAHGHDASVKHFARWVITAQTQEIGAMEQWLRRRDNGASSSQAVDYYGPAMAKMHAGMMAPTTGNVDRDFARGMIAHHQGAIDMATIELAHGTDPDLRVFANNIQRGQGYEIAWLQRWLAHPGDTSFPSFTL